MGFDTIEINLVFVVVDDSRSFVKIVSVINEILLMLLLFLLLLLLPCLLLLITLYLVVINECCCEAHRAHVEFVWWVGWVVGFAQSFLCQLPVRLTWTRLSDWTGV